MQVIQHFRTADGSGFDLTKHVKAMSKAVKPVGRYKDAKKMLKGCYIALLRTKKGPANNRTFLRHFYHI